MHRLVGLPGPQLGAARLDFAHVPRPPLLHVLVVDMAAAAALESETTKLEWAVGVAVCVAASGCTDKGSSGVERRV